MALPPPGCAVPAVVETPMGTMSGVSPGCLEGVHEETLTRISILGVDSMNDRFEPPPCFAQLWRRVRACPAFPGVDTSLAAQPPASPPRPRKPRDARRSPTRPLCVASTRPGDSR